MEQEPLHINRGRDRIELGADNKKNTYPNHTSCLHRKTCNDF